MRHIVFWFSAGRSSVPSGGNSAPNETATMQQTVAPPQAGRRLMRRRKQANQQNSDCPSRWGCGLDASSIL